MKQRQAVLKIAGGSYSQNCLILGSGNADKISLSWNQTGHFYKPDKITIAMKQAVITGFNNFYQKKNCGRFGIEEDLLKNWFVSD